MLAAPGFAAFPHRHGGDDQSDDRVGPGPAEQGVGQQADQRRVWFVRKQPDHDVLAALVDARAVILVIDSSYPLDVVVIR